MAKVHITHVIVAYQDDARSKTNVEQTRLLLGLEGLLQLTDRYNPLNWDRSSA